MSEPSPSRPVERPSRLVHQPIVTVQNHILREQRRFPGASGEFSWLLSGITLATKLIEAKVRRAGLSDILGVAGDTNIQGEVQQKLDVYANEMLLHALSVRESVAMMASEENEHPLLAHGGSPSAKYIVVFDPLDGSSNIDSNISVGTTFSILRRTAERLDTPVAAEEVLQPGTRQIAAGYVVYGSSTMLVYSVGNGAHGFTLDPAVGAYVLSHPNIRIPRQGKFYSMNEANLERSPAPYQRYVAQLRRGDIGRYSSRYVGSMIADVHRTLIKGGVFLYPPTDDFPQGKLRLLYEANPIAFLVEQAGGRASDGRGRILDVRPESIHQRTPLIAGGPAEMDAFEKAMAQE
ncbi:MAG: class 1 fructose-bisphosphatase [Pirellulales bacterium]